MIEITFDPNQPVTEQFTFTTTTNTPNAPYLFITEPTTISITLTGADWAQSPLGFVVVEPDLPQPTPVGSTITFTVQQPGHYFIPWVFNFKVNSGGVQNIASPLFYLINANESELLNPGLDFALNYIPSSGDFQLRRGTSNSEEIGLIPLGSKLVLLNVVPCNVTFDLTGATYDSAQPIVWSAGQPTWISGLPTLPLPDATTTLSMTITPGSGQATGLQFAVVTEDVAILSPDPILINATIGDG
jgi:hypothetical protein